MQNAGIGALGLDWRYLAFDVHPDDLAQAIAGAKAMKYVGLNLTLPHKLLAVGLVDFLDESARQWGAVNTIRFEAHDRRGRLVPLAQLPVGEVHDVQARGFNTDADAVTRALEEDLGFKPAGASILLLGAGGAGQMAALKLAAGGARDLFLVNRTVEKAQKLAASVRKLSPRTQVSVGYPPGAVDLILNATSLGLRASDALPLDLREFPLTRAGAVFDMIYRPAITPLLMRAEEAGCRAANGSGMLLYQGAVALEIWSGHRAPLSAMGAALKEALAR